MMEEKDRYLCLELILTFFLLYFVISLFGELFSGYYRLYLIVGLICGFGFSWFNREKSSNLIRVLITTGALATFAWMIYSLSNSSFLYKEVVLICIKSALILEIVLSFNACLPPFLTYIQTLSIPLFMGLSGLPATLVTLPSFI